MSEKNLILIAKDGCHLCDEARAVVQSVLGELEADGRSFTFDELSILEDQALYDRYWEEIPVLLINNQVHDFWRVDPERLRAALLSE